MINLLPRQARFLTFTAALLASAAFTASAVDVLVLNNGQRREGEIVGVQGANVQIRIGPATSSVPLADIASVEMAVPDEFVQASRSMEEGNEARALVQIRPVIDRYRGLPLDWVKQAFAIQGDALIELGQLDEAERVFTAFQEAYPEGDALASVSTARLDIARENYDAARAKLEPVIAAANEILLPDSSTSARLGRAFLLMGQIREADGDYAEALDNYLRTVTVYYTDAAAVAEAQTRADALSRRNVIVP